jgi:hypothetical protein
MSTTNKWDELFRGQRWRVAEEVTGQATWPASGEDPPVTVTFTRGAFEIPAPGAYSSPLSTNLGRRGLVLQQTDETGEYDIPGARIAVGAPAVRKAREQYGAVW